MYLLNVKNWGKGYTIWEVEELRFAYPQIHRVKHVTEMPGLGPIRTMEGTGKHDKTKIRMEPVKPQLSIQAHAPATAEGVKTVLRRMRPEEEAEIAEIDRQIKELKSRRAELKKKAWQKAHVVTLREVLEQTTLSRY